MKITGNVKNGDETGKDCGGSIPTGEGCLDAVIVSRRPALLRRVVALHVRAVRGAITDYVPWVGGSWEGHYAFSDAAQPYFAKVSYNFTAQTQYGKTGVRCAR